MDRATGVGTSAVRSGASRAVVVCHDVAAQVEWKIPGDWRDPTFGGANHRNKNLDFKGSWTRQATRG